MRVLEKHGKIDTRVKKRGVELQNQVVIATRYAVTMQNTKNSLIRASDILKD
jgi:hypothetical protein